LSDKPSKKKAQRQSPTSHLMITGFVHLASEHGGTAILTGGFVFAAYFAAQTIQAFAGHQSMATFALTIAAHINTTVKASLTVAGLSSLVGLNEFRRHRNTKEYYKKKLGKLQKRLGLDPTEDEIPDE
jgi:hypothetical protein